MTIIFLLISISLVVALLFLGAFLWAVRSGQYEDTYTPAVRMLFEETEDKNIQRPLAAPSTEINQAAT
ncbi:cbb3-type cytochrome oxidase assembly protein CcoS [Hymenobacter convexus]|uniref:cbb3-type cytochrome oxidase assembly protein CcoS n=1 Tax=Hymenobacter sp. CA1UV-4 TaxID=3063782 RepID=UPI002713578B|nr:cbb3-type cytochrome oxidase assembly protein CcoS [Hymenobacter sp. CA1UV-4]MDO7850435.1 cbb3-type cytochrome oxidase assembly protein CcoS [Hymenobacter sp. CA1UV-4]